MRIFEAAPSFATVRTRRCAASPFAGAEATGWFGAQQGRPQAARFLAGFACLGDSRGARGRAAGRQLR